MASKITLVLVLSLSLVLNSAFGEIICEDLPRGTCAFAISSSGKRCLVENSVAKDGTTAYQCRTSGVTVDKMTAVVETDECVKACGVDRAVVGISSDSLLEPQFTAKLCSAACYQNCPNIIDLYINLAAAEGVILIELCEAQRTNPHRAMTELKSSGAAAGPISSSYEINFVAAGPVSSNEYGASLFSTQSSDGAAAPTSSQDYTQASAPSN
ncbi:hypothetical protein GIB67_007632 [Kingdonia uniflora]|uniref:PAR1 protein n=1 Tax=Kingdonia uniflora TaxID=39325 RepID=A0A7J7N1C1_9MAGN|nr:hypothetical protein GIB67_007632 [Kingdonia uniflora]